MSPILKSLLLLLALALAAMFVNSIGTCDVSAFRTWGQLMDEKGIVRGYLESVNVYPPLTSAILGLAGKIIPGRDFRFNAKLAVAAFLLVSSLLVLAWTRDIGITALFAWAMLLNSAQGYTDLFYAPTLLGCFWSIQHGRPALAGSCFAAACLTKQLPLILGPFLLVYFLAWPIRLRVAYVLKGIAGALAVFLLIFAIYGVGWVSTPVSRSVDPCVSGNTLNFNWLYTYWMRLCRPQYFGHLADGSDPRYPAGELHIAKSRDASVVGLPTGLFAGFYLAALILFARSRKNLESALLYSLLGYLSYVMLCPGVHENHWAPATMIAVLLCWIDRRHRLPALAVIVMANVNLATYYGITGSDLKTEMSRVLYGLDMTVPLAAICLLGFLAVYWHGISYRQNEIPEGGY